MRVTLHNYQPDALLRQKDGVNLAYNEIAALLNSPSARQLDLDVCFHDFLQLCGDEAYAYQILSGVDCVISNVGPHAHYYFYLREKLGLTFRIVRDVREAYRSNYLLQEYLCRAYLRDTDTLFFASIYAREVFFEIFNHLVDFPTLICYPLMRSFPPKEQRDSERISNKKQLTLGYVGRLSEDKNFPQLIDLLILLEQQDPGRYRLLALGDVHSPSCNPLTVTERLRQETQSDDLFHYFPPVEHDHVWEFYNKLDVFLFPSTSNIETFGRVLIEASYNGIPIIAGDHAAAPELLPRECLVPVSYYLNRRFSTHFDFPLGEIDVPSMASKLASGTVHLSQSHHAYEHHPELFLRAVTTSEAVSDVVSPAIGARHRGESHKLIRSVRLLDMPEPRDLIQTNMLLRDMLAWFYQLQDKGSPAYRSKLDELLAISKYPERTIRYIEKSLRSRGDFTNVGGVDFELCHIAGFYPNFEIQDEADV